MYAILWGFLVGFVLGLICSQFGIFAKGIAWFEDKLGG